MIINPHRFDQASGYAVDFLLDFTGNDSDLITLTTVGNSAHGSSVGTWSYAEDRTLQHTRIASAAGLTRREPLAVGGVNYSAATKLLKFDLDEAAAGSDEWEGLRLSFTGGLSHNITVTCLVQFNTTFNGGDSNVDFMGLLAGGFATSQLQVGFGDVLEMKAHGQIEGGASSLGRGVPVPAGEWISLTLRINSAGDRSEVLLIKNSDGSVIGCTEATLSNTGDVIFFQLLDYLLYPDGNILCALVGIDHTHAAFPLESVTVGAPDPIAAEQTNTGEITLSWTSKVARFKIERQHNGGSWSTLEDNWRDDANGDFNDSYVETGLTDGDAYKYRVSCYIGSAVSAAAESNAVTIDDASVPTQQDDFDAYGNFSDLNDAADWVQQAGSFLVTVSGGDGSVQHVDGASGGIYHTGTVAADMRVEVTYQAVGLDNGQKNGPAVRCQSGTNSRYEAITDGDRILLRKVNSGTIVALQDATGLGLSAGHKLALEASGTGSATRLKLQKDVGAGWVDVYTAQDPGGTYLDGGFGGLGGSSGGFDTKADDWVLWEL